MAAKKQKNQGIKITTPVFMVSYPQVFEPKAFNDQKPKYSITMLFDKKKTNLTELQKAAMKQAVEEFGPKEEWPDSFKWPFRDGDKKKDQDGYAGCTYVRASTLNKPGVVDKDVIQIDPDSGDFYAGCYAIATIVVKSYNKNGGTGVAMYLQNIQKVRDGEPLAMGGGAKAEDDFKPVDDGSDDADSYSSDDDLSDI